MFKLFIILFIPLSLQANEQKVQLVDVKKFTPSIKVQMRYFTPNNFVGSKIKGYKANKCLMTIKAARALNKAQQLAKDINHSLLVHDCYRPQRAVNHFIAWSKDAKDIKTKNIFYPNIKKDLLFKKGYIAKKSGHSRGSTIDLTLYDLNKKKPLNMGTVYDFLDPLSHTKNPKVSKLALKNRQTLVNIMHQAGFKNYSKEWWHYTLKDEPNKAYYLDVLVK